MSSLDEARFHWADYIVFCVSLCISLGIGIFYAIKDRRKENNEDFLLAGRKMKVWPMMASTFATVVPSVGYIAFPVEVYYFGFGYLFNGIGACLGVIPVAELFAPAFHRKRLFSAFEYLEERFNPEIRKMASILQTIMQLIVMGIFTYAPAVALSQASGLSIWLGIVITSSVCTVYTTLGGMKAVIWSDFVQVFLMFAGISVLAFKSIMDLGGFEEAFKIIYEGGRINEFNLTPDPFVRSSVWSYLIGAFFACFVPLSSNQLAIQRYCTVATVKDVKCALYLLAPIYFILTVLFLLTGLAMYGHFAECDPIHSGEIESMSQMVPLLVLKVLSPWPGTSGLFIACIFAASLSTVSSGQNALAAIILKDLVEPTYLKYNNRRLTERQSFFIAKIIAFGAGIAITLMAFLVVLMGGDLFQLLNKFMGIFIGPIGGLFTIAILITSIKDARPVLSGFISSAVLGIVIAVGSEIYTFQPDVLPIGTNCTQGSTVTMTTSWGLAMTAAANSSLLESSTVTPKHPESTELTGFIRVFNLNPLYYTVLTYSLTLIIAVVVDQCIKCHKRRKSNVSPTPSKPDNLQLQYKPVTGGTVTKSQVSPADPAKKELMEC